MSKPYESAQPFFAPPSPPLRGAAVTLLRAASRALDRLARRLSAVPERRVPPVSAQASFEFHAEPGAAEGALYVDGHLVGFVPGVRRL